MSLWAETQNQSTQSLGEESAQLGDLPQWKYASQHVTRNTASVAVVSNDCKTGSLRVEDPDFVAVFSKDRWTVSWRWNGESPKKLQTRVSEYKCTQLPMVHERYCAELEKWISKGWLQR